MSQGQNESSNDGIIMALFFVAVVAVIWIFFGVQISNGYMLTKRMEYYLLKILFIPQLFSSSWEVKILPYEDLILGHNKNPYTFGQLKVVGSNIGYYSRWIYLLGLAALGAKVLMKNPLQKFKRNHDMKSLAVSEQRIWPAISPVVKLDLVGEDVDKGPWAMSRRPVDFARYYKLLDEGNKLNRDRAEKLFAMQLGKLWEGTAKLPPHVRALFACFAAQACGDIKVSEAALNKLSIAAANKKEDYSWVPEMLAKYENNEKVQNVIKSHAYVYTVMASLLKCAREFGVLQSPRFIWLRPKNRQLWYILNGVGRRVSFAEVGGIYAHWIAEEVAEHPIERPYVVKAVDGLERALLEVKFD